MCECVSVCVYICVLWGCWELNRVIESLGQKSVSVCVSLWKLKVDNLSDCGGLLLVSCV